MRRFSDKFHLASLALGLGCAFTLFASPASAQSSVATGAAQQQARPGLTQARMDELRNYFYLSDMDNDGSLILGELASLLVMDNDMTKYTRPELKQIIASVDYNYNQRMEENEMLIYMAYTKPSPGPVLDEDTQFFNSYDENGDGFIQLIELRTKMADLDDALTDEDIAEAFNKNDFDHDKKLTPREFKILMQFEE